MTLYIGDRSYRSREEVRGRLEELAEEYPGLHNPGSRKPPQKVAQEYEALGRHLDKRNGED
jgi:hypothetical protein